MGKVVKRFAEVMFTRPDIRKIFLSRIGEDVLNQKKDP